MEFLFKWSTQYIHSSQVSAGNKWDVELNTRREIPYTCIYKQPCIICCSLYEPRGFLWQEKLALFTNEKIGSTIPAKSWKVQLISHIKHTCKIIVFFSHVLLWLFSGLEILVQHHSLYNKWGWQRVGGSLIPFHAWILKKYSCVTNTINCVSHVTDLEGKTSNYSSCVQCCRKIFRFSQNARKHSQVMSSGGLMNVSS